MQGLVEKTFPFVCVPLHFSRAAWDFDSQKIGLG